MNSLRQALDQAVDDPSSPLADAAWIDWPAVSKLEGGLRCRVHGAGHVPVTDMASAVRMGGIGRMLGWLLRAARASCKATVVAVRAWVAAGQLGPDPDVIIGRHTGARC